MQSFFVLSSGDCGRFHRAIMARTVGIYKKRHGDIRNVAKTATDGLSKNPREAGRKKFSFQTR